MHPVLCALLLVLIATPHARGDVIVHNKADQQVTIVVDSWDLFTGTRQAPDAHWVLASGSHKRLLFDDQDIEAREFRWRVKTAEGETPLDPSRVWIQRAGSDGHVRIVIEPHEIVASAGPVRVVNNTDWDIKVHDCWYIDGAGYRQDASGSWTVAAGQSSRLFHGGNEFAARKFRASLGVGNQSTAWIWRHSSAQGEPLTVTIDYDDVIPPSTWTTTVAKGDTASHTFCSSSRLQTLVFRLQNLSQEGDVDIVVKDMSGRVVAESDYSGTSDDRCMLHVAEQGKYRIEVHGYDGEQPIRCRVSVASISHLDILGEVVVQEGLETLIVGGLVELFADEDTKKDFWDRTGASLTEDALAMALIEMLMQVQREKPDIDPLSDDLAQLVQVLRGNEHVINVRGAFLDELMRRIRIACGAG